MSDTIWVAIITALATTIPQIIIAIINYYKDIKQKQLELFEQNRLNTVVEFLDTIGETYSKEGLASIIWTDRESVVIGVLSWWAIFARFSAKPFFAAIAASLVWYNIVTVL